ncbi:MAG: hypothetical protein IPP43_00515 [Chitinophagaceae bacterium]|nr:hypothetical protein [Chitinophagaceae bacterium]
MIGLPAGVTGTFAGGVITITGSPSVSGTFNYTVTTTGPCIIPTANGRITVTDDGTLTLSSAPGTDNQTVCINTPIINITYAVGGTGTGRQCKRITCRSHRDLCRWCNNNNRNAYCKRHI